jgi:tRNA dimethylallyltransferase
VPPNEKLRKLLEKKSTDDLFKILKKLDPERALDIDAKNPRRLIRAIEIATELGRVPKLETHEKYHALKIGIKIPDEELKNRINRRIDKWFRRGFLKELKNLHKKGLSWKRMSEIGLEYKLVAEYLQNKTRPNDKVGQVSKEKLKERMQIETWQYVKRQNTWFKRDKEIIWLPPKIKNIEKDVRSFLRTS